MNRIASFACVCVAAALLLAGSATASPADRSQGIRPKSFVVFSVPATNGLRVFVEGAFEHASVWVESQTQATVYRVRARLAAGRLKARFGAFGRIDVGFRPTRVLPLERPGGGCGGFSSQYELGVFTGSIRFRGEDGYVEVDASRVRGEVVNSVRYNCDDPPPTVRRSSHRTLGERISALNRLEREAEGPRRAVLEVRNGKPDGNRALAVYATRRGAAIGPSYFLGGAIERRGAVQIFRVGAVKAPSSSFQFNLTAGTATVTPPPPFSGTASVATNPDGTKSWSGTLAVDVLGAEQVQLVGYGLRAFLGRDFEE